VYEYKSLKKPEWVLLSTILIFIFTLYIISKATSFRSLERLASYTLVEQLSLITVEINGLVQKPGMYKVQRGTTLRSVLVKARPKPLADITGLNLDRVLEESCRFDIPLLQYIHIEVRGCVEQIAHLVLPANSRICDLKEKVHLSPLADKNFFKRRRLLKNNEVVYIPPNTNRKK